MLTDLKLGGAEEVSLGGLVSGALFEMFLQEQCMIRALLAWIASHKQRGAPRGGRPPCGDGATCLLLMRSEWYECSLE